MGIFYDQGHAAKRNVLDHIARDLGRDPKTIRKWLEEEAPKTYQRNTTQPIE
jgi:predicted transcriptional regulator